MRPFKPQEWARITKIGREAGYFNVEQSIKAGLKSHLQSPYALALPKSMY
jgi:hypothetical protein